MPWPKHVDAFHLVNFAFGLGLIEERTEVRFGGAVAATYREGMVPPTRFGSRWLRDEFYP